MTAQERRAQQVCSRLMGCEGTHKEDKDWATNDRKQLCWAVGCFVPLCEYCAGRCDQTSDRMVFKGFRLYCRKHAKATR